METYFQALRRAIVAGRDPRSEEEGEEEMEGGVCEDMRGLCLEGGGGARGGGVCGDARDDGGGVVDCIVLDLTHGPSLFGIAAAKEGTDGMYRVYVWVCVGVLVCHAYVWVYLCAMRMCGCVCVHV